MLRLAILLLLIPSLANAAAIDEVNLFRKSHGLRPFKHDAELSKFAQMKAEYRAQRGLKNGHQGPRNPPGTSEGTAEATPMWGWLSCCMEEDHPVAGAGIALGDDGERYMVLVCRGGRGIAPKGRSLRPVSTSHLTPEIVHVSRDGSRRIKRMTDRIQRIGNGSTKSHRAAKSGFVVGGKDKDGNTIVAIKKRGQ